MSYNPVRHNFIVPQLKVELKRRTTFIGTNSDRQERTATIGQPGKKIQERTARKGQLGQNCQDKTARKAQPGHDGQDIHLKGLCHQIRIT